MVRGTIYVEHKWSPRTTYARTIYVVTETFELIMHNYISVLPQWALLIKKINKLKWNSLNHRRNTIRLQMMYKIINRIVDLNLPDYSTFNRRITRRNDYKLTIPFTRIDSYKFSFFPATVTMEPATKWSYQCYLNQCIY